MTKQPYLQLRRLFFRMCDLSSVQQAAVLARIRRLDEELAHELATLLDEDKQPLPIEDALKLWAKRQRQSC